MITNKILSSIILFATFWISSTPLAVAFYQFLQLTPSGILSSTGIMMLTFYFVGLARLLVEQISPGWPQWMQDHNPRRK